MLDQLILYITLGVALAVTVFSFQKLDLKDALSIGVLAFTALALVWTTVGANNNARIARIADMRPVILRDGVINWSDFKKSVESGTASVNFFVSKNIAKDISGYVVNSGKKYPLSFSITVKTQENTFTGQVVEKNSTAGWTLPDKLIMGATFSDRFERSDLDEGFYLLYKDIEGNCYKTYENNKQISNSSSISC